MSAIHFEDFRLKRLHMRSWRRGMKEMDLILGPFAEAWLAQFSLDDLDAYESLLAENDQEIYSWITGVEKIPEDHSSIMTKILSFISKDRVT